MSRPMTARQIRRAFRKFGVRYRAVPGWTTRNRNHVGPFGPVYGYMVHHTGDDAPDDVDARVIRDGRSGLPGPLAHFGGRDDGVTDLHSTGRANHAGGGDPWVLDAVVAEEYGDRPPAPRTHTGGAGSVDGNTHFYGEENYFLARMTRAQRRASVRRAAAILDHYGWSSRSVIGHKEWSDWKSDPNGVDMAAYRRDVQRVLDAANDESAPEATPAQVAEVEEDTPAPVWHRMIPIRRALRKLRRNTKSERRRRRITAALVHIREN